MKAGMISLGCSKNQVDSEMILGLLTKSGFEISLSIQDSDLIILNTCGFIDEAKNEAIEEIASIISLKKPNQKFVVCGCLATRYKEFIEYNFKDVDLVISLKDYPRFPILVNNLFNKEMLFGDLSFNNRVLISSKYSPYVRIAAG